MCLSTPKVPAAPAAPAPVPTEQDPSVVASIDRERRRQLASMGRQSTILTGGAGVTGPATTAPAKTLLGQ